MEYKSGDRICGCTLRQQCGHGAYGEVWLAEDTIGARVAVKIISNEGRYSERELAGLRNYKDCNHPNLLKIRYVEITDKRICCIMDAADDLDHGQGEYKADTLANRLNKFGRMDGKEITAMLDGLLAGLEELHRHGLVHRDIKPDNILWVNGRPTLADVGLIAHEGKGSLVGTPGFMSPKLLSGQGQADTSDDFYALGKVIYCALTGMPVGEYPSIPENMTISLDASLGRAVRESCKHPVRSSAEFRSLLQGKILPAQEPDTRKRNAKIRKILAVSILILLLASVGLLWQSGKTVKKTHPKNELDPDSKEAIELDKTLKEAEEKMAAVRKKMNALQEEGAARMRAVQSADADSQKDLQDRIRAFFRKNGFLPGDGKLTPVLFDYRVMNKKEIHHRLWSTVGDPRLQPDAPCVYYPPSKRTKTPSSLEMKLYHILFGKYPDFDRNQVTARQEFWRKQAGTPGEIQRKILESDPLMQAIALDSVIRQDINTILHRGKMSEPEEANLNKLVQLREELLDPRKAKKHFMSRQQFRSR